VTRNLVTILKASEVLGRMAAIGTSASIRHGTPMAAIAGPVSGSVSWEL